jgi:hypothetical protein
MNINLKLFMICGFSGRLKLILDHNIDNLKVEKSFYFLRLFSY